MLPVTKEKNHITSKKFVIYAKKTLKITMIGRNINIIKLKTIAIILLNTEVLNTTSAI